MNFNVDDTDTAISFDTVVVDTSSPYTVAHNHIYTEPFLNRAEDINLNVTSAFNYSDSNISSYNRRIHDVQNFEHLMSLPSHFKFLDYLESTVNSVTSERMQTNIEQSSHSHTVVCIMRICKVQETVLHL